MSKKYTRKTTLVRHAKVMRRFKELHEVERLRYDDVLDKLVAEYDYSAKYVEYIIKLYL
jgi:hypothetical protein